MMLLETFPVGAFQCNCSILACADTKEAVVVDPGGEHQRILEIARHFDLTIKWIIHTHAHLDHIYETRDVKEQAGGTIALHKDDLFLYDGFAQQAAMFGWKVRPVLPVEHWLTDGEKLPFGKRALGPSGAAGGAEHSETIEVIHTPGHTPGSCCFRVDDADNGPLLLAGDTLFQRSIGRTDLPGGDFATIERSIKERIYSLDPDTRVIAGHGPDTTVGDERLRNPFVTA